MVGNSGSGEFVDSTITSYGSSQIFTHLRVYSNGVLSSQTDYVYFYNTGKFLDSVRPTSMNIDPIVGSPDTTHSIGVTVYYNDASGHDSTAISYDLSTGGYDMEF